jgi:hypothetical protein
VPRRLIDLAEEQLQLNGAAVSAAVGFGSLLSAAPVTSAKYCSELQLA